ncbi:hypothetical protein [Longimicrobium sp.]|uniref:hypothetical protein n=1 Tax=Longimicrobium sp. TaxID=2029185 RepID=UPI002E346EA3|nr:hypothetical protein [Longimicrobium sp.]HEX6042364.1 hypothetical protein [Longimicrobium sp.]
MDIGRIRPARGPAAVVSVDREGAGRRVFPLVRELPCTLADQRYAIVTGQRAPGGMGARSCVQTIQDTGKTTMENTIGTAAQAPLLSSEDTLFVCPDREDLGFVPSSR